MPFVKFYLPEKFTPEEQKEISLSVHESLITVFNIPKDDYFHVINKLQPEQLIFPDSYLDIPHTADFVYINIICGIGRTIEMKKALYAAIAQKISARTKVNQNDVFIVINETAWENWSFGQGLAQMVDKKV